MSAQSIEKQFKSQVSSIGRATLSSLYPNDFEYYALFIELVDSKGVTVDFFAWPIMPDEIRETDVTNSVLSIRKTMTGINVQKNSSFNPQQISIRGDFGRKFKAVLGGEQITFAGFGFSISNGKFQISKPNFFSNEPPQFSSLAKTGYGCLKMLEAIKNKSKQPDQYGYPHSLYLYNPVLGNNYQVEFNSFTHLQDKVRYNMIPAYNAQLTAVASLNDILSRRTLAKSALRNVSIGALQKGANNIVSNLRKSLLR